ncbi:MAK10-like protein [Tanacetum coccineum]
MGDENPIRTLGDYSKPSHEGYRNTIELLVGNNVVPLRSDTIRLVQNECSFHGLWSKDPNQHLKDFFKLVDSLDLDAGTITTWEDLTTRFLPQFFLPGKTAKLRNDILMFQQHHGESISEAWTRFNDLLQKVPHHGIDRWLQIQIFMIIPNPQPQALGTTFEARVRDYMAAHTERMEKFENAIFKQREEINDRMTEMFELTTNRAPKKVLIREEAKFPVNKNVNSISLTKGEEERSEKTDVTTGEDFEKPTKTKTEMPFKEAEKEDEAENEPNKKAGKEETTGAPSSQPVVYYLKHRINEKLIKGLVGNHRFNDSLSGARVGKIKGKTYNLSPRGPVYEAILRKKITRKEDIGGNFKIPCNIGGLKHMNALVDQGSDVIFMPLSTYMKLTDERPAETDIRLSLASHSYIYPLGIAEDILVEVSEHVHPFDKGTITLRSGKSKISFHRIPESLCKIVLEWEERIKLHLEREMKYDQWKSKNFKSKHHVLVKIEGGMDDEEEVT